MSLSKRNMVSPNFLVLCIDDTENGTWKGRMLTKYSGESKKFDSIIEMMRIMSAFYTKIRYPEASTKTRSFSKTETRVVQPAEVIMTESELAENRGQIATFFVYVQFRQNATWQGELQVPDKDERFRFDSELEMLKLIENEINTLQ